MHNITKHTGTLNILRRLKNPVNGNPRFTIEIACTSCITLNDSAYNYDIENLNGKEVEAYIGTHYNRATLKSVKGI